MTANTSANVVDNNFRKGNPTMSELGRTQIAQLTAWKKQFRRLQKKLEAIHKKTGYEDLAHGVLALEIAEHTVEETLEHTGLGGEMKHKQNPKAYRQAKQWYKIVKGLRVQGDKVLKTHPSEDLETALKALEIAEGSLEEVAEGYE
ncbi:MAG TPA: hypothetical protein VMT22_01555 [Terriglobales bacterium]|jgi:hypothetical protein|nr:hypothetical protein [Terriglobales bacterium]